MKTIHLILVCILALARTSLGQDIHLSEEKEGAQIRLICTSTVPAAQPLFVLQYKQTQHILDTAELNLLDPKEIKELTILKNSEELDQYGKKAEHGVVLIKVDKSTMNMFLRKEEQD